MVLERDFVGYNGKPPRVEWPNGKKLAVQIVVNYEAGGEKNVLYGDDGPELVNEFSRAAERSAPSKSGRDLAIESEFEYETRIAVWRLLDIFDKYGIKTTFFASAKSLDVNHEAAQAIVNRGHEICGHGYRWIQQYTLGRQEEKRSIAQAIKLIKEITGQRPLGWFPRSPSPNTLELVAEEGGFVYYSAVYNDEIPYYVRVKKGEKRFLLIPYTSDINDWHFYANRFVTAQDFFEYVRDSFDYLRKESQLNGKMMSVGLHGRAIGRPGRAGALEKFLEYAKNYDDVFFPRRIEIANWWLERYPPFDE